MIYAESPYLLELASYCAIKLNIPKDTKISIHQCCLKRDQAQGWAYDNYDEDHGYDIELEITLDPVDLSLTLCHEMVHIKQFTEGRDANENEALKFENILYKEYKYSVFKEQL